MIKKRKSIKLRINDYIVIILCLVIAFGAIFLFFLDITSSRTRSDLEPIASITFKYRSAQRKFSDEVIWDSLKQGSPVYNGDVIRTAPAAEASIEFVDGNVIEMYENTMVQIFLNDSGAAVSIEDDADITIDTSSSQVGLSLVSENGSRIDIASGTAMSAFSSDGETSLQIESGSVVVTNAKGESQLATEGNALRVTKTGQAVLPPLSVSSPRLNSKILDFEKKEEFLDFVWKTENENTSVILIISQDKSFLRDVQRWERLGSGSLKVPVSQGVFYWQVKAGDEMVEGKATVYDASTPDLIAPQKDEVITYREKLPLVSFLWDGNDSASSYELRVSSDPSMKNPILKQRCFNENGATSGLKEGTWYWYVRPYYAINNNGFSEYSVIKSFTIKKLESIPVPQPLVPLDNAEVFRDIKSSENNLIRFAWKKEREASYYHLKIADNPQMVNPKIDTVISDNFIVLDSNKSQFEKSQWYWSISQIDTKNNESLFSTARVFSFVDKDVQNVTLLYPASEYRVASSTIEDLPFMWKVQKKESSLPINVEFSSSPDFTSLAFDSSVSDAVEFKGVSLVPGIWYWRCGNNEDGYALPHILEVLSPFESPLLVSPSDDSELLRVGENPVDFTWKAVAGAQYYKLRVFSLKDPSAPLYESAYTKEQSHSVLLPFPASYIWSVEAGSDSSAMSSMRDGLTKERSFLLRSPKKIILDEPSEGSHFNGLTALKTPLSFTWSEYDIPVKKTFILERFINATTRQRVASLDVSKKQTVSIKRLSPGEYFWHIDATLKNGMDVSSLYESEFTVMPVSILPVAKNLLPKNDVTLDISFFRQSRVIDFSWDTVSSATEYAFNFYRLNKDGTKERLIKKNLDATRRSYQFDAISSLQNGDYLWTVQAFNKAQDGYLLQTGDIAQSSFKIDIPLPKTVKAKETGVLYGNE